MTISSPYKIAKLSDYVYYQEGPGIRNYQNTTEGIKFLNIRCFVNGRLDTASMKKVAESEAFGKYKHFLLDAGDYVVSSSGTLGRIAEVYPEDLPIMLNTSTIRFRPIDNLLLDRLYLRYFLESEVFQQQVKSLATGSVQLNYGPSHLAFVEMPLPPIKIQKAIGMVLDSISRKIDLNNQTSKTLEEIAQTIFKSWFIDFDPIKAKMAGEKPAGMDDSTAALFPDSMEESELGLIPKGWKVLEITELGRVITGKTPSTNVAEYWGEDIPFVTIPDMHGTIVNTVTKRRLTVAGAESQKNQMLSRGSTMVSCIATPGLVVYATEPCQTNQQINSVTPKDLKISSWLYWHIRSLTSSVLLHSGVGTIFANLNKGDFGRIKSVVPTETLQLYTSQVFEPLLSQIESLSRENLLLADIRDNLLPRLISGELQIPEEMLAS